MRAQRRFIAHHLAAFILLIAAAACYALGFDQGGLFLLFLAAGTGLWSWLRVVQGSRHPTLGESLSRIPRH